MGTAVIASATAQPSVPRTDPVTRLPKDATAPRQQPSAATLTRETSLRKADELVQRARFADAAAVLRPLAEAGVAGAMTRLGVLHHLGRGVEENDERAFGLFSRAAALGEPDAMFWLGRMYLLGHGPPRDDPDPDRAAAIWFFESARRGHPDAQYYLGMLFLAGTGVETNATEARKWFSRAAAAGHPGARRFIERQDATR